MAEEKDGRYCSICGGIPPDEIKVKKICVDGIETGIDRLDWVLDDVKRLRLTDDDAIGNAILQRVRQFNYVPTKKIASYRTALLAEYRKTIKGEGSV
ncbi:MAG: NAC family transcription factor [Methanomicrobiales archaeon]|nr:NAC family transcription factor [Methanomicrobiales archaeon]